MSRLVLIRHAPTAWNGERRLQGRTDVPLADGSWEAVRRWRLPEGLADYSWYCSPLTRAMQTAEILGLFCEIEPSIIEMSWGEWEGRKLTDIREKLGEAMERNESLGLDFRPPGGESPRDVQKRIRPWLVRVGRKESPSGAVTHRGIIRALYALASGWDMKDKPPDKLRDASAHFFEIDADGNPTVERLNIGLEVAG